METYILINSRNILLHLEAGKRKFAHQIAHQLATISMILSQTISNFFFFYKFSDLRRQASSPVHPMPLCVTRPVLAGQSRCTGHQLWSWQPNPLFNSPAPFQTWPTLWRFAAWGSCLFTSHPGWFRHHPNLRFSNWEALAVKKIVSL